MFTEKIIKHTWPRQLGPNINRLLNLVNLGNHVEIFDFDVDFPFVRSYKWKVVRPMSQGVSAFLLPKMCLLN